MIQYVQLKLLKFFELENDDLKKNEIIKNGTYSHLNMLVLNHFQNYEFQDLEFELQRAVYWLYIFN